MTANTADLLQAWSTTAQELGLRQDLTLAGQLLQSWAEPQRRYHSLQHLRECLQTLAQWRHLAQAPALLALALWFHDAVYDPQATDNEARSADWARAALPGLGLPAAACERVAELVLATRDHVAGDADMGLLMDIDLAILAAPPQRFAEYERQIREEYAFVPAAAFKTGRHRILAAFLARPRLFVTEALHAAWHAAARRNLQAACAALASA